MKTEMILNTNNNPAETRSTLHLFQQVKSWFSITNLEAIFTVVTLITMLSAWVLEQYDFPDIIPHTLYAIAYLAGGSFGLKAGLKALRQWRIDVDVLMVLAALGAALVDSLFEGAMLLFLFSLSNVLQEYALDRTRNAIRALMKLRPDQALIRRHNQLITIPLEDVVLSDHFVVRPGDRLPLDGVVVEGSSAIDQSPITGESMPVSKKPGDTVLAGTINTNGSLEAEVTKLAHESTLAKLIDLVEQARSEKAKTQRFLDKAEQYYAVGVIVFTMLAIVIPVFLLGEVFDSAFYRAMTLMVAASPCALIISTPASILSAIGNGARKGILFKGGAYVEQAADIKVLAFDKTGTLTIGRPQVTAIKLIPHQTQPPTDLDVWCGDEADLLSLAATVETKSEHPLAKATVEAAQTRNLELVEAVDFEATAGKGVRGLVAGRDIRIGNLRYFQSFTTFDLAVTEEIVSELQTAGQTVVIIGQVSADESSVWLLGIIAFADTLREEAATTLAQLKSLGIRQVVMLTGDNQRVAQAIAQQVGVDTFYADLLPADKLALIKDLKTKYGPVAMVGDGVNDAPALASASIGIAMGAAGTDVALETADVVLMADDLANIPYLIDLSHQTRKTLFINLGFALGMIVLMVVTIFAVNLPLPLAVIGHEGGTVLVVLNGLRLLMYKGQVKGNKITR